MVRLLAAVLASLVVVTGAAPAMATVPTDRVASSPKEWSPRPITWRPCADEFPDIGSPEGDCGTLTVPLDWRRPSGATVDLRVARHRATDPARRIGVVLVNPGGPGSSNAEFALAENYFSPEIRARFDVVGLDMRGTEGGQIIRCDTPLDPPSTDPADAAQFAALRQYNQQVIADCRAANGPLFDHADTGIGAHDMEALRRALGERKISYQGVSYGTLLGQQYAERYGDRVRAMVLDSNIDHSVDLRHFMTDRAEAAEESFLAFVRWCDETPACVLHGKDVLATWQQALAMADEIPLWPNWLRDWVFSLLYGPDYAEIARLIADTAAGEWPVTTMAEYNYASIRLATVCQDFALRIKDFRQYSALRAEELRLAPLMRGGALGHDEAAACIGIPGPPANPPHRLDISDAPTVLLLNSLYDPATPYEWARNVHRQASTNSVLLTYEGGGHGVYDRGACTRAAVDNYLLTLKTPKRGATCPAA
jgi:pimeloyl-ACP methyl ester carboxylesterase